MLPRQSLRIRYAEHGIGVLTSAHADQVQGRPTKMAKRDEKFERLRQELRRRARGMGPVKQQVHDLYFRPSHGAPGLDDRVITRLTQDLCDTLQLDVLTVRPIGSAVLGVSLKKDTVFQPGVSDLDLAVISQSLYNAFLRSAHEATSGFSDETLFDDPEVPTRFYAGLKDGLIDLELMPSCARKDEWKACLREIGNRYARHFGKITIIIYSDYYFLEQRIADYLDNYLW